LTKAVNHVIKKSSFDGSLTCVNFVLLNQSYCLILVLLCHIFFSYCYR